MPKPGPDPLANTDRLLVDGSNLLHAIRRGRDAAPPATLIGRLRAAVPPRIGIELVLDGPPDPGMRNTRVAGGLIVRYAGRRSADDLLLALVEEARAASRDVDHLLVVTDDRDLRQALAARGVRTAGTRWLIGRLDRPTRDSPTTGNRRPPAPSPASGAPSGDDDDGRTGWQPGRGATAKRGNPKRRRRPPP